MNVSEFSQRVCLSPHTIRYYDKIGLIGKIYRSSNGHRIFSENDVKWVEFIQRLKDTGMSLEKILEYARLREKGEKTMAARKELLISHSLELTNAIEKQQEHLINLNKKIALYDNLLEEKSY